MLDSQEVALPTPNFLGSAFLEIGFAPPVGCDDLNQKCSKVTKQFLIMIGF